jgi:peptidyl-prolyl cis-trans isomerase C
MKFFACALILLSASYGAAQPVSSHETPAMPPAGMPTTQSKAAPMTPPPTVTIAPDAAVITVMGVCNPPAKGEDCKTVLTRKQFESLIATLQQAKGGSQEMPAEMRYNLADQYANMTSYAAEAEKVGLDKLPDTQLMLTFARNQVLTQVLLAHVKETMKPTREEVEAYYNAHVNDYYQGTAVQRIIIPVHGMKGDKSKAELFKATAEEMHKRLASGEDAATLQKEVYDKLGFNMKPPDTSRVLQKASAPADRRSVFDLKAGEVSEIFTDDQSIEMYRIEGPKPIQFDRVKAEITSKLEKEKIEAVGDSFRKQHPVDLNMDYFSPHSN